MNTNILNKKSQISLLLIAVSIGFIACDNNSIEADAHGNFEADETLVSAETAGKLVELNFNEGELLELNSTVGLVDTIMPALQLNEINSQYNRIYSSMANVDAQINVLKQQKQNLETDLKRIENMKQTGAATQKQYDDVTGNLKVIDKNIDVLKSQKVTIRSELLVIKAKERLIKEQLQKCRITNPLKGTVIDKYAELGEITAPGKPLYKIANLEQIILRAYISGSQLHAVKIGQNCKVRIDKGQKEYKEYSGTITWIAKQAEFTPKIIQTKEERVNMVYALKVEVQNDASIKMGMPGEVIFSNE